MESAPDTGQVSLLQQVAEHETGLLAEVKTAERDGRAIVEAAQSEAATLLAEAHQSLERELADLRRVAADEREGERRNIETATASQVRTVRENSVNKRAALVEEILGLLLPTGYTREAS